MGFAPAGDAAPLPTPPSLTVSPTTVNVGCGQAGTVSLAGAGTFTTTVTTAGVPSGSFTVSPTSGTIPGTVSFTRNNGYSGVPVSIVVNLAGSTTIVPVTVIVPASCP